MFSLPLLPPPPSALLPTSSSSYTPSYATESSGIPHSQQQQQASNSRRPKIPAARGSLAALTLDERILDARKTAIQMYGWSWLKPAGCTKTMLGRREEEAEREEVARQLQEVEEQERMVVEGEEEERRAGLAQQAAQEDAGQAVGSLDRDLDEEIPDADGVGENADDEDEGVDLDDEVPDADVDRTNLTFGTVTTAMDDATGITDDVEHSHLGEPGPALRNANTAPVQFHEFEATEQEALANAMLEEDEQGIADADMGVEGRDLDDEVPEADEEEWQHTDSDASFDDDEDAGMDISNLDPPRQILRGVTPGQSSAPPAEGTGSGRRWFSGGARRNLFGRGTGNLFGMTPPQREQESSPVEVATPRRSGRRPFGAQNRARDSLD